MYKYIEMINMNNRLKNPDGIEYQSYIKFMEFKDEDSEKPIYELEQFSLSSIKIKSCISFC